MQDEYEGELEENESEPIEPLDEYIEKVCQGGDESDKDEESSGPIEENEVQEKNYEEQSGDIKGDPESIEVVTIRGNLESIPKGQPQEIVVPPKGYLYVFSGSCPEPESPFWNISYSNLPSWDIHHAIDLVPVIFNSYSRKTLWHLLGTKLRFTATYLLLCAKVFKAI